MLLQFGITPDFFYPYLGFGCVCVEGGKADQAPKEDKATAKATRTKVTQLRLSPTEGLQSYVVTTRGLFDVRIETKPKISN